MFHIVHVKRILGMSIIWNEFYSPIHLVFAVFDPLFADVVQVSNHWILAQAMAHAPVPNFDVPLSTIAFV